MSCYDDSFDEKQFALYNYDATYQNVNGLFNKHRMLKNSVSEEYRKLGNTSRQMTEKVNNPGYKNDSTARHAEQLIHLKDFIDYCDGVINKNIKNLNYYERWIFDEVLVRGKRISSIIVNNNRIDDEDNIFKPILDFQTNQSFYTFEQQDNKNTKVHHDTDRIRFEIENL